MTDVTRVTEEYPGENKGVLEILNNPWNEEKAMLLVEGSDEWGVKAGGVKLIDFKKVKGASMLISSNMELIQGEIKQVSFVSAKMWVIQASDGDMYMPIGNKSQDLIKLGEGTKVKVKGYITRTEIIIPEAGESNTYTQKAINIISYEKKGE